jgi:hypothetical protein
MQEKGKRREMSEVASIRRTMRLKFKFGLVLFILFLFVIASGCKKQKAEWKGTTEVENGVKVIKNPGEPLFGELSFDLEEDLAIGNDKDEKYMFYRAGDIELDNQDNIYLLDSGNCRVQKFDRNGNYLQTFGRKGQGPGEFENPFRIFVDDQNNIYVSEMRSIQVLDSKGKFIRSISVSFFLLDFVVNQDGSITAYGSVRSEEGQNFEVVIMDSTGKILKHASKFPGINMVAREGVAFMLSHDYTPYLCFASSDKKGVIYGYNSEYKLFFVDQSGNNLLIIKKDELLQSISDREKDKIINDSIEDTARQGRKWPRDVVEEAANFPKYRPFFNRIISDDRGRIYVRKIKSVLEKSEPVEFDIFNRDGYHLYKASLPFTPELIRNGCLYDIYASEETGEVKIKRYRVKNWDKIKAAS